MAKRWKKRMKKIKEENAEKQKPPSLIWIGAVEHPTITTVECSSVPCSICRMDTWFTIPTLQRIEAEHEKTGRLQIVLCTACNIDHGPKNPLAAIMPKDAVKRAKELGYTDEDIKKHAKRILNKEEW